MTYWWVMSRTLFVTLALAALVFPACAQTPQIAPVANPPQLKPLSFSIGGRVLPAPVRDARFGGHTYIYQWPGTWFEASFAGSQVCFDIGKGKVILHVIVDNQPPIALPQPAPGIRCASGFANAPHTIRVDDVTENQQDAPNAFDGFAIPAGEKPLDPPHRTRQIEFIGDSHTVGYGDTSPTRNCTNDVVWATTDTSHAFGPLVAAHYDADDQINAISGHGIVRNYNGGPGDPVPVAWPYILFDKQNPYNDPAWHPQIIVIALGTNDFSTRLRPGEKWKTREDLHADFEATYVRFLQTLRTRNPHAYVIVWATDMADGEIEAEARKVVNQWKATGETRVTFIPINGLQFSACNYHPSLADHQAIATILEKTIDATPGIWQGK
jgi:lysophospholipase L1-like esterase